MLKDAYTMTKVHLLDMQGQMVKLVRVIIFSKAVYSLISLVIQFFFQYYYVS